MIVPHGVLAKLRVRLTVDVSWTVNAGTPPAVTSEALVVLSKLSLFLGHVLSLRFLLT
jgi:hypothetical protein